MEPRAANRRDELPAASRYELLVKIASGGMATVYVGRSRTPFARNFAVKRAHAHLVDDPVFRRMFVAEARLAARIHHPNVVAVQDVVELDDELLLVMDYVEGLALVDLVIADPGVRARAACRIVLDVCAGLQAAQELRGDDGEPLGIVHRDVSPHNILVGVDGVARVTDFGIAKSDLHTGSATATGALKGKLAYMAPEYVETAKADRRADVYALGVVLWETLTGQRLFRASSDVELMKLVSAARVEAPSSRGAAVPPAIDAVVLEALARSPEARFATADALATALEAAARGASLLASHREVGATVEREARAVLDARRAALHARAAEDAIAEAAPEAADEEVEPERTETLAPPTSSLPALAETAPAPATPTSSRAPIAIAAGVVAATAIAVVALRYVPSSDAHAPAALAPASHSSPSGSPSSPASLALTPASSPTPAPSASTAPSTSSALATSIPTASATTTSVHATLPRIASSAPPTSASTPPTAAPSVTATPSLAPPNPYKRP